MGLSPSKRCLGIGGSANEVPNPDPNRFSIIKVFKVKNNLVAMIRYHGCTTFEGRKILVFKDLRECTLRTSVCIDPHFSDKMVLGNYPLTPIARFRPTDEGWALAVNCALIL